MSQIKFTKRQQFIDALEARRPWAVAYDKRRMAEHKKAEAKALADFRAECRKASKMSYDDLRAESGRRYGYDIKFRAPECPTSMVARLDAALANLAITRQEAFTVDDKGHWRTAHFLLTHDENARKDVCA